VNRSGHVRWAEYRSRLNKIQAGATPPAISRACPEMGQELSKTEPLFLELIKVVALVDSPAEIRISCGPAWNPRRYAVGYSPYGD